MKEKKEKEKSYSIDDFGSELVFFDWEKIARYSNEIRKGITNYALFQKYNFFKWPLWISESITRDSKSFNPFTPNLIINDRNRSWISFSNLLSTNRIAVDPSGMISPLYDVWSIEFWIFYKGKLFRSQENVVSVSQFRDIETSMIISEWKGKDFKLTQRIFGTKTNIEEVIIEIDADLNKKSDSVDLLYVIRPYNIFSIGGLESIEYKEKSNILMINGNDRILVNKKADYCLSGNGELGDLRIKNRLQEGMIPKVDCGFGMATLALGYRLKDQSDDFKIRISLSKDQKIIPMKIDIAKAKKDYIDYTNLRKNKGFNLKFPDKKFESWFYSSKISALNYTFNENCGNSGFYGTNRKSDYYVISAYNKMGFFSESLKILDSALEDFVSDGKAGFSDIVDGCYIIISMADFFFHSRDLEYLRSKYKSINKIADMLYQRSKKVTERDKGLKYYKNSIDNSLFFEDSIFDTILLSFSLHQFAYLARCLGIFNDEIKFDKENTRLEGIIVNDMKLSLDGMHSNSKIDSVNEMFIYDVYAGYPFRINTLDIQSLKKIIKRIADNFKSIPFHMKSIGGVDIHFSIIYAINLLISKDIRVYDFIKTLMTLGQDKYILPDIVDVKTGACILGEGDSLISISTFFTLMRYILFMDLNDRLEIFPMPKKEWFTDGQEIVIENAPSRFGPISFTVKSIKNEVRFQFLGQPKYVPPDILINFPFNIRIKTGEDFIIKKKIGNSYLITGWPSVMRFVKL